MTDDTRTDPDIPSTEPFLVELPTIPFVNFAIQQCGIPLIEKLLIHNNTDRQFEELRVEVGSHPEFFPPLRLTIPRLGPKETFSFPQEDLFVALDGPYLAGLSSTENVNVSVRIFQGEAELARKDVPVPLHAFNRWIGSGFFPKLLAAFVTPNLEAIVPFKRRAAEILEAHTGDGSMGGYQSPDRSRRHEMIRAVYEAVAERKFKYSIPPANDDEPGQLIRFPDRIVRENCMTCLDASLLFASILEACGLRPLIALEEGHAYVGCHIDKNSLPAPYTYELEKIRKRVNLNEIVFFESTSACGPDPEPFVAAENKARGRFLADDDSYDEIFEGVVGIYAARERGIRPLPLKQNPHELSVPDPSAPCPVLRPDGRELPPLPEKISLDDAPTAPQGRIDRWKQKLLDLSLRNKLLNFKPTRGAIEIFFHDPAKVEDSLAAGKSFTLLPAGSLHVPDDYRDRNLIMAQGNGDPLVQYTADEFDDRRLHCKTETDADALNKSLLTLYRQSQSDLEEGGFNTLFLTLGMVRRTDADGKAYKAPLLLLPMRLIRKSVKEGFTLERSDEDAVLNVTLLEMLRVDYQKTIRGIDPDDLPTDKSGIDVARIFQIFRQELRDFPDWELLDQEVWLGNFSFQKSVMWEDLDKHSDDLLRCPVVDHLVNHPTEAFADDVEEVRSEEIDAAYPYAQIMTPLSADSSQLAAILSAEKGKNFVLHGPPGSGKSQTIANIIAHCLYKGKSVLFVAEKRAALEVVHQRLSKLGLDPFCLELHSNKAGKRQVLDQFVEALNFRAKAEESGWQQTAARLEGEKKNLNEYVRLLHNVYPNGRTLYGAISDLISRGGAKWAKCRLERSALELGRETVDRLFGEIPELLRGACRSLPDSAWADFQPIRAREIGYTALREIAAMADPLRRAAEELNARLRRAGDFFRLSGRVGSLAETEAVAEAAGRLARTAEPLPSRFYTSAWESDAPILEKLLDLTARRGELLEKLRRLGLASLRRSGFPSLTGRVKETVSFFTLSSRPAAGGGGETPIERRCAEIGKSAGHLAAACRYVARALGVELPDEIPESVVGNLARMIEAIRRTDTPEELIDADWPLFVEKAGPAAEVAKDHAYLIRLLERYNLKLVTGETARELSEKYKKAQHAWIPLFPFKKRGLVRRVRRLQNDWREPVAPFDSFGDLFKAMDAYASSAAKVYEAGPFVRKHAPKAWHNGTVDGELLKKYIETGENVARYVQRAFGEAGGTALKNLPVRMKELRDVNSELGRAASAVVQLIVRFYDAPLRELSETISNDAAFDEATLAEAAFRKTAVPTGPIPLRDLLEALGGYMAVHPLWQSAAKAAERISLPRLDSGLLDVEKLAAWKKTADEVDAALRALPASLVGGELPALRERFGALFAGSEKAAAAESLEAIGRGLTESIVAFRAPRDAFAARLELEPTGRYADMSADAAAELADKVTRNPDVFEAWCNWNKASAETRELGLASVLDLLADRKIAPDELGEAFRFAFNAKMVDEVLTREPVLGEFLAGNHEQIRKDFRENDEKYREQVRLRIISELAARTKARLGEPGADRELGLLKREITKKTRHKPVRTILDSLPNLLTALKPCLLMSPISVAQYLPTSREKFDLVIFDEASQIPTCDAIGAIARGNQLIVVGDPKQLPPTSFFQRGHDEEPDEDEIEDLESILDECLTARLHGIHLRWHYRSRHESLIAFSNRHYYDSGLYTFPTAAPAGDDLGVHFRLVKEGVYDRAKKRTNPAEARALVDDAVARMMRPEFRGKSLGIVTFSEAQKGAIEDLLEEERHTHPEIDPFFSADYPEPVFVKNLENVQGDERDVMYFSIGYGPDEKGNVSMNFGPVNRAGGERRLNVAVTRAKEANIVFSSITSADIDLGRVSDGTLGPLHLKEYLEYAEKGADYLRRDLKDEADARAKDLFVLDVASVLRRAGYHVRVHLGLSRYKVDLAVSRPESPDRYVVGIECDGPTYARAATARDRDILRQSVLGGLHWNILRVWSVQWFKSPRGAEEDLLRRVAEIFENETKEPKG